MQSHKNKPGYGVAQGLNLLATNENLGYSLDKMPCP
jgi:hypothetical protein